MKIRIAIIEDEYFTRQAIRKYVEKLGEPYVFCGEACDGQEGLELLRRLQPDIALVDITMPIMNGIDMMEHAFNENLPTRMIILTGYSDFSYARAAVHFGAREYLLKPLRIEDLKQALEHVAKSIVRNDAALPEGIDVKKLLSCQLAEQLTRSGADSVEVALMMEHLNFPQESGAYYVALAEVRSNSANVHSGVLDSIFGFLQEGGVSAIGYVADSCILCLVMNVPACDSGALCDRLSRMAASIQKNCGASLRISLSNRCEKPDMIHEAYREAQVVQQYHLCCSAQDSIVYTSENMTGSPDSPFNSGVRHTLALLLRQRDSQAIENLIAARFDSMNSANPLSIRLCATEMLSVILEYSAAHSDEKISEETSRSMMMTLFSIDSVDAVRQFIAEQALRSVSSAEPDENAYAALIRRVQQYINENFSNSALRLEDIAQANFISTQHLCSVYRRSMKSTVGSYLFDVRMQHARKLINDGQRSVTVISEACGYDDPGYFCKCFRKKFGMTPKQYIETQIL